VNLQDLLQARSRMTLARMTKAGSRSEKPAVTCGNTCGRYWDRTSDLFGVNQDAAPRLTSGNATTCGNARAVQSSTTRLGAAQRCSALPSAPHLLPTCIAVLVNTERVKLRCTERRQDRLSGKVGGDRSEHVGDLAAVSERSTDARPTQRSNSTGHDRWSRFRAERSSGAPLTGRGRNARAGNPQAGVRMPDWLV
jgi:hypothetical protein